MRTDNELKKVLKSQADIKECIHQRYEQAGGRWCELKHVWCEDMGGSSKVNTCTEYNPISAVITAKQLLDYINRLEAENDRLKEKRKEDDKLLNDRVQEAVNVVSKANQKYIDELEKRIEDYKHLDVILHTAIDKLAKDLKAEAYKECIEKVKMLRANYGGYTFDTKLNNLLNELVGEETPTNDVKCKECEYLMFSDCYGECSKAYKGIVSPDDSCGKGKRKEGKK